MRHARNLLSMALIVTLIGFATSSEGGVRRGKTARNGLEGTIVTVGTFGFTYTVKEGTTLKVACDANTKFIAGDASSVKAGVRVGIVGNVVSDTEIHANEVRFLGPANNKSKSK